MPHEPVFGTRDRIFLPRSDPAEKIVPLLFTHLSLAIIIYLSSQFFFSFNFAVCISFHLLSPILHFYRLGFLNFYYFLILRNALCEIRYATYLIIINWIFNYIFSKKKKNKKKANGIYVSLFCLFFFRICSESVEMSANQRQLIERKRIVRARSSIESRGITGYL